MMAVSSSNNRSFLDNVQKCCCTNMLRRLCNLSVLKVDCAFPDNLVKLGQGDGFPRRIVEYPRYLMNISVLPRFFAESKRYLIDKMFAYNLIMPLKVFCRRVRWLDGEIWSVSFDSYFSAVVWLF